MDNQDTNVIPMAPRRLAQSKRLYASPLAETEPMDREAAIAELARGLTLCAPSGMSEDDRAVWLAAAWAEVAHVPAGILREAMAAARKVADHPAKIVPAIMREVGDWERIAKQSAKPERPIALPAPGEADSQVRAELAQMMRDLKNSIVVPQ